MKRIGKIFMSLLLFAAVACGRSGSRTTEIAESAIRIRKFPMVSPPAMMQDPREITEYMALHYWNAYVALTPAEEVSKGDLEQNMANYIYILEALPLKTAQKAVSKMADLALSCEKKDTSSTVLETFVSMTEKYLYDPNSPLRNEDLYSPFTARLAVNPDYDQATRDRYEYITAMCRLNEKGTKATDFRFCDSKGRSHSLYGISSDYILLFFSNPGCESCMEIINTLKADPVTGYMQSQGLLKVLNIYIDEDLEAWMEYMPVYPQEWYNGFDPDLVIRNDRIYSVRAIPSLYLLDKEKTVLLKDATTDNLLGLLHEICEAIS